MSDHGTAIEWTQAPGYKGETWNPVTGCDRVSPGCAHCYALDLAARLKGMGQKRYQRDGDPKTSGPGFGLTLHPDKLEQPMRWTKPRMVFVNSMSDLFHPEIPDEYIERVFEVMECCPQHIFQVLTKRPERMRDFVEFRTRCHDCNSTGELMDGSGCTQCYQDPIGVAPEEGSHAPERNIWLGVSIENRRFVHRADLLRETPAAVRFISAEPLLGPLVHPRGYAATAHDPCCCGHRLDHHGRAVGGVHWRGDPPRNRCRDCPCEDFDLAELDLTDIDWLIVGGESGPEHRRVDPQWVRDLRDATRSCDPEPAFFLKQWGGRTPKAGGRELDGRTWDEWPATLEAVA
jgi:protein gp37